MPSKLGRTRDHRKQVVANLATSVILHEKITTTLAKAKTVLPIVDKIFTAAKKDTLDSRRDLNKILNDRAAVVKIFTLGLPNIKSMTSGFASLYKVAPRQGDGAPMALIVLNENIFKKSVKKEITNTNKGTVIAPKAVK